MRRRATSTLMAGLMLRICVICSPCLPADSPKLGPADLDADGFIGLGDLMRVLAHWNQDVPARADPDWGDATGDGYVGVEDLSVVLGQWNAGTPPAQSPGGGSGACAGCCAVVLGRDWAHCVAPCDELPGKTETSRTSEFKRHGEGFNAACRINCCCW